MKESSEPKLIALHLIIIALLFTGVYVVLTGHGSKDFRLINYEPKFFNEGWYYEDSNGNRSEISSLPVRLPTKERKTRISHKIGPITDNHTVICFYSQHQNVTIRVNGEVIYTYDTRAKQKSLISYRAVYNFVHLPQIPGDSVISIETDALIQSTAGEYARIYFGDSSQVLYSIVIDHIANFLLGVMFFVGSVFLFGTNYLFSRVSINDKSLLHLAFLTLTISLWQLDDSTLLFFFTGNLPFLWCMKYLTQLIMPIFTYLFIKSIIIRKTKFLNFLFWGTVTVIFLQFTLQITGIRHLTNTIFISHLLYFFSATYTLISLLKEEWLKKSILKYLFILSMLASIVIFIITALSLFNNLFFSSLMSFGLAFVFFSMILLTYQKQLNIFEAIKEAETYKKLAFVDIATGVYNKTAWYTLTDNYKSISSAEKYCLILFDMNNLKKVNDKYGHLTGDKMIKAFCDCLTRVLEGMGAVYRIGGDEFVTLCKNVRKENVEKILRDFDEAVKNQEECEYKFSAAYGYEFFTPSVPADFQNALKKADEKMYSKKVEMKLARS